MCLIVIKIHHWLNFSRVRPIIASSLSVISVNDGMKNIINILRIIKNYRLLVINIKNILIIVSVSCLILISNKRLNFDLR